MIKKSIKKILMNWQFSKINKKRLFGYKNGIRFGNSN